MVGAGVTTRHTVYECIKAHPGCRSSDISRYTELSAAAVQNAVSDLNTVLQCVRNISKGPPARWEVVPGGIAPQGPGKHVRRISAPRNRVRKEMPQLEFGPCELALAWRDPVAVPRIAQG